MSGLVKRGPHRKRKRGKPSSDLLELARRQNGRCAYCRRPLDIGGEHFGSATRDHVVPRSKGGKTLGNVVAACRACNGRKGSMNAEEFKAIVRTAE